MTKRKEDKYEFIRGDAKCFHKITKRKEDKCEFIRGDAQMRIRPTNTIQSNNF